MSWIMVVSIYKGQPWSLQRVLGDGWNSNEQTPVEQTYQMLSLT